MAQRPASEAMADASAATADRYASAAMVEKLRAAVSTGYSRGKLSEASKMLPREQKDWYD
jgi:hypothetical protein